MNNKNKELKKKKEQLKNEIIGYIRTIFLSFCFALFVTILLSVHARNEMIKNLYAYGEIRSKIEREIAQQILSANKNLKELLVDKNSAICIQVGDLYEAIGDFANAQYAYELAVKKAKRGKYTPYYKLITALVSQEKFDEAYKVLDSVSDVKNSSLIKFKTRAYITIGDKYYSLGKFLKAATNYENALFYYKKFKKYDPVVLSSIQKRLINSYINAADVIVKNGYNSDAARFLKKALELDPENYNIQYKLAVVYADLDPMVSVKYFEPLLEKIPQEIDYNTYNKVLIKVANIADLEGKSALSKYYRYRIHSIDLFINNKVVYKDDIEFILDALNIQKIIFKYKIKFEFRLKNESAIDIYKLYADFVLKQGNKVKETQTVNIASRKTPLYAYGEPSETNKVTIGRNIFTKKELSKYSIDIYLYKDKKYKTFIGSYKIPNKSIHQGTTNIKDIIDYMQ